ncbi:MAG: hypothetical protein HDR83_09475 [Bacteroides sp.]|nr:hypothetical protein [Bacteroidales bacterium]MBD5369473.1 hypothetical protein [Bacteroides sp.]
MNNENILEKLNHKDGMTVPDGYFEDFASRMAASLPEAEWEKETKVLPRSFWDKVRPYIYLAAMFAGVWCMMSLVDVFKASSTDSLFDNNQLLAQAMNDDSYMLDYYVTEGSMSDSDLLDDLYESGFDPSTLIASNNQ